MNSPQQKIITVSGLYSGIGKTELCCHIVSLMPGCAAVKVTINDHTTEVIDDEASIMAPGKDTWRLKTSGAAKVVWIRAQEKHLAAALADGLARCSMYDRLLIEGNSVLAHLKPTVAVFICDERICADKPPKPSRAEALAKADIVLHNLRAGSVAALFEVQTAIRQHNPSAQIYALAVTDKQQTAALFSCLLPAHGVPPAP